MTGGLSHFWLTRIKNAWNWKDAQGQWQSRVLTQNDYAYNNAGMGLTNALSDQNGLVRTENYGYDELYRLTSVNYGDGQTQTYAFDPMDGGAALWPRSGQRRGPGPGRTQKADSTNGELHLQRRQHAPHPRREP